MSQLRWGVIGCGNIAGDFVKAFENTKRAHKIVAVAASSSVERAQAFIEENQLADAKALGSYADLLKEEDVEIVYIGTQTAWHFEWAINALDAGKHVLCETPMAINVKQCDELIAKAKEVNKFLMEGFWSRFFPAYAEVRRLVESGELGAVRFVNANMGFPLEAELEVGETIVNSIGCFIVDLVQMVFGGVAEQVSAKGEVDPETGAEKWAAINIKFGENRNALLHVDSQGFLPNSAFICFETGYVEFPEWNHAPTKMRIHQSDTGYGTTTVKEFRLDDKRTFVYPNSTGFRYEQDHVFDVIRADETVSPVMPLEDSRAIRDIIDRVRADLGVKFPQDD